MKMKKILIIITWISVMLLGMSVKSNAITKTIGTNVACDQSVGCTSKILGNGIILCTGATCPTLFSVDLLNTNKFVGIGSGGCRESTGGMTWTACTTQPPNGGGGGILTGVGVTTNGTWVSSYHRGGTGCVIGRSIDGGVTWSTSTTLAAGCSSNGGVSGNVRCNDITCVIGVDNTNIGVYSSSDDGVSWGYAITSTRPSGPPRGFVFNGTDGFWIGTAAGDTIYTITGNSGWILGLAGFNPGGSYMYGINDSTLGPVAYSGSLVPKRFTNIISGTSTNITLPNGTSVTNEQVLQIGTDIYVFGVTLNPSCTGNKVSLWLSRDHGTSFNELQCLSVVTFSGGDYAIVGSNVYFSVAGTVFVRFSMN